MDCRQVLVVGFHRSQTSVISQWLHQAGLSMGNHLMPPAVSNPLGHYEDMALVSMQDRVLTQQQRTWQIIEEELSNYPISVDTFNRYVQYRNEIDGRFWGAKDPRICLFLPQWQSVLGDSGRYLILIRHWSGSIQSLYKRHSSSIAIGEGSYGVNARFWTDPTLSAKMWLAYNRQILSFLENSPSQRRLVFTQKSLLLDTHIPFLVNKAFGLSLDENTDSPIRPSLVSDIVDDAILSRISKPLQEEMEDVWRRLLAYADYRAPNESPSWRSTQLKGEVIFLAKELLSASCKVESTPENVSTVPDDLFELLDFAQKNPHISLSTDELVQRVSTEKRFVPQAWEGLARVLLTRGWPEAAEHALQQVLLCGINPPYIFMLIGSCREALFDREGAEYFYRLALERNPSNPVFCLRLANLLLSLGRNEDAEKLLCDGINKGNTKPLMYYALANCLDQKEEVSKAIELLEAQQDRPELLEKQLITLIMKSTIDVGMKRFHLWAKNKIRTSDVREEVVKILASVQDNDAREDLARRIAVEWLKFS